MADKEKFIGSWKLNSSAMKDERGSVLPNDPLEKSIGIITYLASGDMTVLVMAANYPGLFANRSDNDSARVAAENGFHSYSGTYEVDEVNKTVTHHVEIANHADIIGKDLMRSYLFQDENTLCLESTTAEKIGKHENVIHALTWKRSMPTG